jgi:GT2 family glycosyltransferase
VDRCTWLESLTQALIMDGKPRVAAVFATMNRAVTAASCVRALADQTRPPDLVVVADNVSSDSTPATLESLELLPFPLIVHRMTENRGNAGGVEEAMELAFGRGADFVWILDDDSVPRQDALGALLAVELGPMVVPHAMQVDPKSGRLTWPMWIRSELGWILVEELENFWGKDWIETRASWTGAMISREVWKAVGPVNGALFIRGEDEEYPWRIAQSGFTFAGVTGAVMDHPGPENIVRWSCFGKNLFFERSLADWKLYYKTRNMVWLKRRQSGIFGAIAMAAAYAIAVSWIDGPSRLPLVWSAVRDGWHGKLGRWSQHPA